MSIEAIEAALHQLSTERQARIDFRLGEVAFLQRLGLSTEESAEVQSFDVAALQRRGASALLTYGFWLTNGPEKNRAAYLAALRKEAN